MAFAATVNWEVRTTGSDSNGGGFDPTSGVPGTDYSQQDAAQVTYTDLVIGATNTQLTSAGNPFTAAHVGNIINITGGTGFTVQRVQVLSVSGGVATCDKAAGTASSTGGAGKLGGGLVTIATALTLPASGNTIWVKSGTYTITAALSMPTPITLAGYSATHGDNLQASITTSTNSIYMLTVSGGPSVIKNLNLSSTATTKNNGIQCLNGNAVLSVVNCILSGFSDGINGDNAGAHFIFTSLGVSGTEIKNCTANGINNANLVIVTGCYIHGNSGLGLLNSSGLRALRSIFAANSGGGLSSNNSTGYVVSGCVFYKNLGTVDGLNLAASFPVVENCVFYGNGRYGFNSASAASEMCRNNAYGANGTSARNTIGPGAGDVTLTADPFVSATDFTLNTAAGGGALLKGLGFPATFPGLTTASAPDIGAAQSASSGGSTNTNSAHTFVA